ncbi:hypothetical protein PoB_001275600 [Plakobranchus ocellatus]|uniref:Uncharacterized protein n=1 Tax=Plakobranchus ocellatus TaxID=259542 RepID=A0AAV3YS99_9GAST|nr:hypothetical protein PoB_001275600 [Plakobranchus ocellatus]
MANYLIMPFAKINQNPTPGYPRLGLSVGPTLLVVKDWKFEFVNVRSDQLHAQASPQQGDLRLSGPPSGQGSNSRQKGPCRSQGGLASHCATDTPP